MEKRFAAQHGDRPLPCSRVDERPKSVDRYPYLSQPHQAGCVWTQAGGRSGLAQPNASSTDLIAREPEHPSSSRHMTRETGRGGVGSGSAPLPDGGAVGGRSDPRTGPIPAHLSWQANSCSPSPIATRSPSCTTRRLMPLSAGHQHGTSRSKRGPFVPRSLALRQPPKPAPKGQDEMGGHHPILEWSGRRVHNYRTRLSLLSTVQLLTYSKRATSWTRKNGRWSLRPAKAYFITSPVQCQPSPLTPFTAFSS